MLSVKIDILSKSNTEIIKKGVSILKMLADYIGIQRKKVQKKQ